VTREIPATATVTVDHRAYLGRPCGDGFAVVSREGELTVVDARLRPQRRGELGGPVGDFDVAPDGTWAWAGDGQLRVGDVHSSVDGEVACRWLPSGQALWVANGTGDEVHVTLRTPDLQVVRSVTVPDEFGDSMVALLPHGDAVVLWVAAGQDGQQSWLISEAGTAERLPADDCLPALFGPDGTWLLAADDARIARLTWPDGVEDGALSWDDIDPEAAGNGSDAPGADLMLLPGGFVSWSTGNGRIRTIDLATMTVADEIALAGHPVRTVAELYPSLAGDLNPCGDFGYSVLGTGGTVLSVHGKHTLVLSRLRDWSPDR